MHACFANRQNLGLKEVKTKNLRKCLTEFAFIAISICYEKQRARHAMQVLSQLSYSPDISILKSENFAPESHCLKNIE